MKKVISVFLVLLLMTAGVAGGILIEQRMPKKEAMETLLGDWISEADITKEVAAKAEVWLEDIEGVTVTTKELEEKMGPLTIVVVEHYEIDEAGNAVHTKAVSQDSYDECVKKAYTKMAEAFEELITVRFEMAGLDVNGEQTVQELFSKVFGMTMEEYLTMQLPDLVPSYEELCKQYTESGRKQVTE